MFTIRFDMRAPTFGAPTTGLYAAAIDMSAWAERHGCVTAEFEHFGLERGALADQNLALQRKLLTGLPTVHGDRRITVSPPPSTGPTLMWGGARVAAARRAGRYGLGILANGSVPGIQEAYEAASREYGHEPSGVLLPPPDTPTVTFVADDARDELGTYLLHDAGMYAQWNSGNRASAGISAARDVTELRNTYSSHRIIDTTEAGETVRGGGLLNLSPLCGGIPPEIVWPYLRRAGEVVTDLTTTKGSNA